MVTPRTANTSRRRSARTPLHVPRQVLKLCQQRPRLRLMAGRAPAGTVSLHALEALRE